MDEFRVIEVSSRTRRLVSCRHRWPKDCRRLHYKIYLKVGVLLSWILSFSNHSVAKLCSIIDDQCCPLVTMQRIDEFIKLCVSDKQLCSSKICSDSMII
ncbi:hypothetical protein SCHPADRAFT_482008 [Schizopora paradoxa]|uniref:Uncharacterized protein n=1 Tax=Schizopora paradoxa TaxID=27342 RepID=A0A0H2S2E7_9AGAM|nr:hypothetical protein SCHPADRAFT_482008 [Schizopora paradoxa]